MSTRQSEDSFGCGTCWPSSIDAALQARARLSCEVELIDESHFHVMILACPECSQRFISVFTEQIDWVEGEDPQSWTLLPITPQEVAFLSQLGSALTEPSLHALGQGRRSLRRDYPKDAGPRCFWSTGIPVLPHD